jgi:hypothetical protein
LRPLEDDLERTSAVDAVRVLGHISVLAGDPDAVPEGPGHERFLDGARAIRAGDFAAAFEAFIEVLQQDRDFAAGLAKDAGRAIILLLGLDHPVVDSHFRAFSMAVNP